MILSRFNIVLLGLGAIINALSYSSIVPIVIAAIFYLITFTILFLTPLGGKAELRMFSKVFSVGFLAAGVAAVYANQFQDAGQLYSDASGFFEMATFGARNMGLIDIQIIHEGALGIVIWRAVYDFFELIGFEKSRYIGITINITSVALSGVIGIKMIRRLYGNDKYRFDRLTLLVASCGLFLLFSGIHLRDSVVLLAITALAYQWLYYLAKPDVSVRLAQLVGWSLVAFAFLGFLRDEFVFVPLSMAIAAAVSLFLGRIDRRHIIVVYGMTFLGTIISTILIATFVAEFQEVLDSGRIGYAEHASETHESDSLGMALIVNQILPVRLILGSIYLLVFPIPVWTGFQLESAYHLFKSINAIYFYFVIPLLAITFIQVLRIRELRKAPIIFLLLLSVGFTLAVAMTSLETRHFGSFLMPLLIIASIPDLRLVSVWKMYKTYLSFILLGVILVHVAWIFLKFLR